MTDHVCKASIQTISDRIGYHRTTVIRALHTLIEAGLVKDLTPDLRDRPHILRPTEKALRWIEANPVEQDQGDEPAEQGVAESDTKSGSIPPGNAESDSGSSCERHLGVAGTDMNHTLLKDLRRDNDISQELKEFYQSKVDYINRQQLAFYREKPIIYCRFHSFDGKVFKISHPDPNYVEHLNAGFRMLYLNTLTLWISIPDFQVEFIERELGRFNVNGN
jgi:DNA-binding MarR family transcriptional regulator